jgi:hypothetical protein
VSAAVAVAPVVGRRDFSRFIAYPYERHARDPRWIPPLRIGERERLDPRKNPFFEHAEVKLFLARRGDLVVGRIGAIDDRLHNETHRDNVAMFGFFEAADGEAARALLETAERWAMARGRGHLRGPINPSLNDHAGLLIDGFDTDPMLLMPHNPPEYATFIEAAGYAKVKDLFAWICELGPEPPPIVTRLTQRMRESGRFVVRPMDAAAFAREAARVRQLYCSAWERNWGFVPPTEAEFNRIARELKPIVDPRCALAVEADGRLIACVIGIPDINQALKGTNGKLFPHGLIRLLGRRRYINQARVLLLGVDPEYRSPGLYPLLLHGLHQHTLGGPYQRLELSWVLEDNRNINKLAEQSGARRYKTYRLYQKALA